MSRVNKRRWEENDRTWLPLSVVHTVRPDFEPFHGGSMVQGRLIARVEEDFTPGTYRSWIVNVDELFDQDGLPEPVQVSSRRLRRHAKVLIIRIGDWDTEQTTLDPLASSLKSQLSLLLPPDGVDVEYIRTLDELVDAYLVHTGRAKGVRQAEPWGYTILVGHGRSGANTAIRFGYDWKTPSDIVDAIRKCAPGGRSFASAKFISLCCDTGAGAFAQSFSSSLTTTWVGPRTAVHSFEAAGFVLHLFGEDMLRGRTWADAFKTARTSTSTFNTAFQCWVNGEETAPLTPP